jgi:hypothetical protein
LKFGNSEIGERRTRSKKPFSTSAFYHRSHKPRFLSHQLQARPQNLARFFSRVTTSGFFIPNFDGLRFIAIALVVLFHAQQEAQSALGPQAPAASLLGIVPVGFVGVTLFFAISGFVLALPFANHYLEPLRNTVLSV